MSLTTALRITANNLRHPRKDGDKIVVSLSQM